MSQVMPVFPAAGIVFDNHEARLQLATKSPVEFGSCQAARPCYLYKITKEARKHTLHPISTRAYGIYTNRVSRFIRLAASLLRLREESSALSLNKCDM